MIVFINGPFGVGKTTLANVLVERLPNTMIFDPEEIGSMLLRMLGPHANVNDFQDLALWRSLTVEIGGGLRSEYRKDLVVPMSIFRHDYLDQIVNGLRAVEPKLTIVQLVASHETLVQRIDTSDDIDARHWRLLRLGAFSSDPPDRALGEPIDTDARTPSDIADNILALLG